MFKNLNTSALGVSGQESELIESALTYGFRGIDLNIVEFAARVRLKGLAYAKRMIASAKLLVGTFSLPIDWNADEECFQQDVKKLYEYADCAAELGCKRATTILAPASDDRPYHENFELHRRRLHEVCATLMPADIRLAVGFRAAESLRRDRAFEFIHDFDALALLVNMTGSPNIGLLVDIWEVIAGGGSLDAIRKLSADQIVAVQVADMPADVVLSELDEKSRLLPGCENGQIDVAGFVAVLREIGYQGPITLKTSREAFQGKRREIVIRQAAESLDKVLQDVVTSA